MYIHSFRLIAPRKLLEAQLFNQQYQNYEARFVRLDGVRYEKTVEELDLSGKPMVDPEFLRLRREISENTDLAL